MLSSRQFNPKGNELVIGNHGYIAFIGLTRSPSREHRGSEQGKENGRVTFIRHLDDFLVSALTGSERTLEQPLLAYMFGRDFTA